MGTMKQFEPSLHKQFDEPAKKAAVKLLKEIGFEAHPNPFSIYDIDLVLYKAGSLAGLCEVFVLSKWIDAYPYQDMKLVERKYKQLSKYGCIPTYVFALNKDLSKGYLGKFSDIKQAHKDFQPFYSDKVERGEMACSIPLEIFTLLELKI